MTEKPIDDRLNSSLAKVIQFINERLEKLDDHDPEISGLLSVKDFIYSMAALDEEWEFNNGLKCCRCGVAINPPKEGNALCGKCEGELKDEEV